MLTSLVAVSTLFFGAQALTPSNIMRRTDALTSLKYTGVGAQGTYMQVTNLLPGEFPSCTISPFCITSEKEVSGSLAPFDDEMTLAFRGPMTIENIAVYQPISNTSSATWSRVSNWAKGEEATNLVFMNNEGGNGSGEWSICAGNSQSYADDAWTGGAAAPTTSSSGWLPGGNEINIMTNQTCEAAECSGFSRGTANHGWADSKMFVFTFDMPSSSDASQLPAIWALNAQVVRSAQYGCNCRGEGANGGCGELDILEVISADTPDQAISEIYSFKGATGSGANTFARPTGASATYSVVFDVDSDQILINELTEWDYTQTAVTRSLVEGYLSSASTTVPFNDNLSRRSEILGAHRRRHHH
ncbi:hypothetical protein WOLCODRAFT_28063 [Wolfiporia cocos MD-104 SS10]|uniref:glucan endo-1,3-beta-D-glucosidase n=1 Tax=Wolfiporia cocos (strain MD-104) TaxID=742152 RepID=A0A2H3J137_WOLCO|nr:hypothetical protein WOLCODRAFT_28063 [Wolfiporia cocos MD-104 SS10]